MRTCMSPGSICYFTSHPRLQAGMASSSSSPCAACKFLRRKCTTECVFAPYFPPDQPHKFSNVHKIFGASNITKLLNELPPHQREDAVNSLAYEADARVKDPVYGCVGAISVLQRQVAQLQTELAMAHSDLARYAGNLVAGPPAVGPVGPSASLGIGMGVAGPREQMLSREHLMEMAREPQLTREQLMELTRAGSGPYEGGFGALGMAATQRTAVPFHSSRPGSDGSGATGGGGPGPGSSGGGGGSNVGHMSST